MGGLLKHAKPQLRPGLASSLSPPLYRILILGRLFVTRALGSMCPNAPSCLGDLTEPRWGSSLPPWGVQGSLKPRDLGVLCANEAPAAVLLAAPSSRSTGLMVTLTAC